MTTSLRTRPSPPAFLPVSRPASLPAAALAAALVCIAGLAAAPARAEPVTVFAPFAGAGNLSLFSASSGGWVGSIDQTPDPDPLAPAPLSLVSFVLFNFDSLTNSLSGSFEFTTAADLSATLFGTVVGSTFESDPFTTGAQFSIDYTISGGTGIYAGATGFGLSFLQYDPMGGFNNYVEDGLLVIENIGAVPEPGSLALAGLGLISLLGWQWKKQSHALKTVRTDRATPARA